MTRSAPIGAASPRIVAIDETDAGTRLLQRFYGGLYTAQFPDPDERESLANMLDYIRKRAAGWYGPNNYHALIAVDGDAPVGGVIADYLARPNAGVIEFLTASPDRRRQGIGRLLHAAALDRFAADAGRAHGRPLDYVFAEMNDPSRTDPATDNMDPAERAAIWAAWDYRAIGFPYVQPALSPAQSPVTNLLLLARPCGQAAAELHPRGHGAGLPGRLHALGDADRRAGGERRIPRHVRLARRARAVGAARSGAGRGPAAAGQPYARRRTFENCPNRRGRLGSAASSTCRQPAMVPSCT